MRTHAFVTESLWRILCLFKLLHKQHMTRTHSPHIPLLEANNSAGCRIDVKFNCRIIKIWIQRNNCPSNNSADSEMPASSSCSKGKWLLLLWWMDQKYCNQKLRRCVMLGIEASCWRPNFGIQWLSPFDSHSHAHLSSHQKSSKVSWNWKSSSKSWSVYIPSALIQLQNLLLFQSSSFSSKYTFYQLSL